MASPVLPTAADLLDRNRQYVVAAEQGEAISYSQVEVLSGDLITRFGSQHDVTFDLRGWTGVFNGGTPNTLGAASYADVNHTPFKVSANDAGTNKPARLAIIGSLTTTPTSQVGTIRNMPTSVNSRFATPGLGETGQQSWDQRKDVSVSEVWDGPHLDGNQVDFSYNATVGVWGNGNTTHGAVLDGLRIIDGTDSVQAGTAPTKFEIRNCWISRCSDDAFEMDWSNSAYDAYDCLIEDVYCLNSTQGNTNRLTSTTTFTNCVIKLRQRRWKVTSTSITACTYARWGSEGGYWYGHGHFDKRNAAVSPRLHFDNCVLVAEGANVGASGCSNAWDTLGFRDDATAVNSTLLFKRGDNQDVGQHPSYPVAWDTGATAGTGFIPSGMTLLAYQGNESILTNKIQDFHNAHPQFGLAEDPPVGPPVVPALESEGLFRDFGSYR